jgi:hypothetical protein
VDEPPLVCELEEDCPVDLFHLIDIIEEQETPEENYLDDYFKKVDKISKRT